MKKMLLALVFCVLLSACGGNNKTIEDLKHIDFKTLDEKIANEETMVVYFGWTKNCTDSINFQENYLEKHINKEEAFLNVLVVDLDKEAPKALEDRKLREPLKEKYNVMYSPTIVYYEKGKIKKLLEWTPETTDKETGIFSSTLDSFFKEAGYLK